MTLKTPPKSKRLPALLRNLLLLLGISTLAGLGSFWANVTKGTESFLNLES